MVSEIIVPYFAESLPAADRILQIKHTRLMVGWIN